MYYRGKDFDYMSNMKQIIYKNADNPDKVWLYFKRYIYLDDLLEYQFALFNDKEVDLYRGNITSPVAILLDNFRDEYCIKCINYLKKIFPLMGIDYNHIFITSFEKISNATSKESSHFNDIVIREIRGISPKFLIIISDNPNININQILQENSVNLDDLSIISPAVIKEIIEIQDNLTNKSSLNDNDISLLENNLNKCKQKLWTSIRKILKYYKEV